MNSVHYSSIEKFLMVSMIFLTHLLMVPNATLMVKKKLPFDFVFVTAAIVFSFMCNLVDCLEIEFLFDSEKWQELNSLLSVTIVVFIILELLNENRKFRTTKKTICHFVMITFQKFGPWDAYNTIVPIMLANILLFSNLLIKGCPKINSSTLLIGVLFSIAATIFNTLQIFVGWENFKIIKCLWQASIGLSSVYLWQVRDEECLSPWRCLFFYAKVSEEVIEEVIEEVFEEDENKVII